MSVESEVCSGRPSTSRNKEVIEKVRQIVMEDCCLIIREIVEEVGIITESVHFILTDDLCMQRVSAKFIPKLLMQQQKELHVEIAQNMLDCANNDLEFTKTFITGYETWAHGCDPETEFQSPQWKHSESPKLKKARQVCSNVKVMLTCFLRHSASRYAPEGQTINREYCLEILHHLRDAVRRKLPDMWTGKNWRLHNDNAPAHSAHVIKGFLAENNTSLV